MAWHPVNNFQIYLFTGIISQRVEALPPISTGYISIALRLRHASGADMFHFSLYVNPHQVRCAAYLLCPSSGSPEPSGTVTQDFYF